MSDRRLPLFWNLLTALVGPLLLAVALAGCELLGLSGTGSEARLDRLERQIEATIGTEATQVTQCRTIAFGSKPCGGPRSYRVYSVAETDEARLASLVQRYNALEAKINRRQGRYSDCWAVPRPDTALVDGQCAKRPHGAGAE
jgi:cell division protein FtsB